jgi:phage baseplate assembly protein gpV
MIDKNNFIGLNGFVWWVGIIENRMDPLNMGRCQVRIFGWHTDNQALLPTKDLPWSQPMYPLNASKLWLPPMVGEWVVGFFMDGESAQFPIMMGVLPGIKQDNNN